MKLENNNVHKDFKINGFSFSTKDEILTYAESFSNDIYVFLKDWFSKSDVLIAQTSGSTGKPKSIFLKKEFVINSAKTTGLYFDLPSKTTALLCLPIQYIAGKLMLIRALTLGWHLDILDANSTPLKNSNKKYDFAAMVPLQLENSIPKIHLITKIIVGGGVVSNSLQEKLQRVSTEVFATYGMTETITHIAVKKLNNFSTLNEKVLENEIFSTKNIQNVSFYETLPNVKIYKDENNCLVIHAPKVAENIIFTNDVVNLISDTKFEWLGRFDHVINSGGVKLHPEKIEEKLAKIIKNRFFVAAIPDEKLGEKLILIIEKNTINSDEKISLENKIQNLQSLTKFEKPKELYFVAEFCETTSGKIQRKKTLKLL